MFASRFRRVCGWLILIVAAPMAVLYGTPQRRQSVNAAIINAIAPRFDSAGKRVHAAIRPVAVRAALRGAPYLNLRDGQAVTTNYVGDSAAAGLLQSNAAQPVSLASADFDSDGVPDLVSGYAAGSGGIITIHRGNVDALWPYGAALRNGEPPAFLPNARAIRVPEPPDFIGTGDFDADGHWDIVTAHIGSSSLYFLRGDGRGNFAAPQRIALSGSVTAFTTGEINRADGLTDIVVGITNANGSQALVYESPMGALQGTPETFSLPAPANAMLLGRVEGGPMNDLVIAAGNQLVVVHARDRKLSVGGAAQGSVEAANVTQQSLPFSVKALALGSFSETANLAALGDDGTVHLLQNSNAVAQAIKRASTAATFQVATPRGANSDSNAVRFAAAPRPNQTTVLQNLRRALTASSAEWTITANVAAPASAASSSSASMARLFVAGHVSASKYDDLLLLDNQLNQVHILSSLTTRTASATTGAIPQTISQPMSLTASLDAGGAPVAVLPMRVNQHGLKSLVILQAGQAEPTVLQQAIPAGNIFTVTNTSDIATPGLSSPVPAGSLRAAMIAANGASGPAEVVFNIPTSDPNFNPATGAFLIRPLSENVPNSFDNFALPPINNTMTIDGYTQPGASPNTLATGDNAKILIQIDGARTTNAGADGFIPFDDQGSIFRGFSMTGWTNGLLSGGNESGASGIEAFGVGDFIEGNFIGTDPTGKIAMPNRIGVFADNGPESGQGGNVIGGTTPQARNILSGNQIAGALFLSIAFEAQLQGNFVGTDITGTVPLTNNDDGTGLNGPTVTIGGTLPGATNVLSGNGTNVDLNDLTDGNAASNSIVQGNLIGTDATGTKIVAGNGNGVGILHGPQSMLVGGTTPAARNVVAGNFAGFSVFDNAFFNTVQGNYIGTDITGTKALANSQQGYISGITGAVGQAAGSGNTIGGAVPGAGNVISGNTGDGVQINGTSNGPNGQSQTLLGNTIQGNFIGTDLTGTVALANHGNGISLLSGATNNIIGGAIGGSGNVISNNLGNGVLIDPGTTPGSGSGNSTIGNTILSNGAAGVHINTGSGNPISRNSIFGNGALGIDLGTAGPNANSHCQATVTGANNSQNAPVLTAGSGAAFISATATDPTGNTSEFSNAVASSLSGNILSLLGNFDSKASTTYTIEFFSSPSADASGFGQGKTFIASTTVTTSAACTSPVNDPVNLTQADVSVALSFSLDGEPQQFSQWSVGPDFGSQVYNAVVTNNGAATAHNVVLTDALPASLKVSSLYCNLPTCQSPITTSFGTCTVSANTVTCNLGTILPGASVSVAIPVQAFTTGTITNTVSVAATETDPVPANNTASTNTTSQNPFTAGLQVSPTGLLSSSPDTVVTVFGQGFLATSTVTYTDPNNVNTVLPVIGFIDNQSCGQGGFQPNTYCAGLEVLMPHTLLAAAGTGSFNVTNPGGSFSIPVNFTVASACNFGSPFEFDTPVPFEFSNAGTGIIPFFVEVDVNVPSCTLTASSNVPWAVLTETPTSNFPGTYEVAYSVAPNSGPVRTGTLTVAGQTLAITQDAGDSTVCTVVTNPLSASIPAAAGNFSIQVTTSNQSCAYFNQAASPWITVPQTSGLLVGNGTINYSVEANPGGPRTGFIVINGGAFTINQNSASTCFFTVSANATLFPTNASTGSLAVTASLPTCPWTASTDSPSFTTITGGASGTGNGTITFSLAANSAGPRTASFTVANLAASSASVSVSQASFNACTATLSPSTVHVSSEGTTNIFSINTSLPECGWAAVSNNPSALSVTSAPSGLGGSATITYAVAQNTSTSPRTVTITAGCQTFTVIQDGAGATNPVPTVTTLSPTSVAAGSGAFTLTVNGSNFVNGATVNFNGIARVTSFVNATQLTSAILATDVASAGTPGVTVTNPAPGGGTSNSVAFTVTGNNPVPTVTALSPTGVAAGSGAFTLTVNGTNFVSSSIVNFNGSAKTTTFVNATQLTASILAADVTAIGTPAVTVTNPTPGGGTSNSITFNITAAANPAPTITTLSPATVIAGSGGFTLTVNGTGFVSISVVKINGAARVTTFVNATQVTAAVPGTDIAFAGSDSVTVFNPTPGGGTSNAVLLVSNNPAPTLASISPTGVTVGSGALTLTVNGTNFLSTSVVNFGGTPRVTTFVNATQLTAAILSTDVTSIGTPAVTVTNPTPGGGTSAAINFNISAAPNPVPTVTTLSPTNVVAGSGAFTLTVNGTNFLNTSVVNFGGTARVTTFVNATQLTAAILAGDVASVGTPSVTVTNPAPGGGTSNTVTFTVTGAPNPVPAITSLVPNTASAGSGAFTLTVNGSNFVSNSVVQWNGSARTTTFVSATKLTAAITAADIQTANLYSVSVFSPAPGGGTSGVLTFTATTPIPALSTLAPNSSIAGGAAFTLTVTGSNFINTSVVQWKGSNRTTTFVNSTQLTAAITATDIATVGTPSVTVFTPTVIFSGAQPLGAPLGITSNPLTFTISAGNPVPTLTSLAPTSTGTGGAAFTLTLNGTNFISSSVAQWKGSPRTTTFVNATQLTAAITAADVATSGTAAITVVNPTPGGGTSNSLTFTITDFSVSATTTTQTVTAGQSANFTIATATVGGAFPGNVTFTTSGLPTGASASFNPASVSAGTNTVMTVTTTVRGSAQITAPPFSPNVPMRPVWMIAFVALLALMTLATASLAKFGRSTARRLIPVGAFALLLISVGYISGCSGAGFPKVGSPTGTPAGSYIVTVTGTSGAVQHSTTVTLVVQ